MPDQPKTQHRSIRVPDARWAAAQRTAKRMGTDRASLVNAFLAWLTYEPGAKRPGRPAEPEPDNPDVDPEPESD